MDIVERDRLMSIEFWRLCGIYFPKEILYEADSQMIVVWTKEPRKRCVYEYKFVETSDKPDRAHVYDNGIYLSCEGPEW